MASGALAMLAFVLAGCPASEPDVIDGGGTRDAAADAGDCSCVPCGRCDETGSCVPDHSRCDTGEYCDVSFGCRAGVLCAGDPPGCADDGDVCGLERCDTSRDPPICVVDPVGEGTACTRGASAGTCRTGVCCIGCWDGRVCHQETSPIACGVAGSMCRTCADDNPCTDSTCEPDGACATVNDDTNTCTGGACRGGACCTGCWNGSSCEAGTSEIACGTRGADCDACACPTPHCAGAVCQGATVVALGAGLHHTCAVTSDGRLYCWGMNDQSQLGVSTAPMDHSLVPVGVDDATDWTAISIADNHVHALKAGGALYAWGTNTYGELGTGDTLSRRTPGLVSDRWRAVAAGAEHSCGIRDTGALFCWGYGGRGQLGLGVIANYLDPQEVSPGTRWTAVAAFDHTCAIDDAGALHCWGRNDSGQTGSPATVTEVTRPTRVGTDNDWTAVVAGRSHTCGLRTGGALYCFGSNASGQLGRGAPSATFDPTPVRVSGDLAFAAISAGADHVLGRTETNELFAWGDANEGALGIGAPPADAVGAPARVGTTSDWRLFEGGTSYSCGTRGGVLHCFGMNRQNPVGTGGGQLGLGDRLDRFEPSAVCLP